MKKTICVATGTRAEYGLLKYLLRDIQGDEAFDLKIIVTGAHLSPTHGLTINEIIDDGFHVDAKVDMLLGSDSSLEITKSMGLGLIGFADALNKFNPDLLVILGDRYEMLVAVTAALIAKVPVAHIHGGELTQGAFDDSIRHAITKLSHIHFVATEEYRKRVIQLGEQPDKVFCVGGLGVGAIRRAQLLSREDLEKSLGLKLANRNLLITFHPETLGSSSPEKQIESLLSVLDSMSEVNLIFTGTNADTGGSTVMNLIRAFVEKKSNAYLFDSLGHTRYLSCLKYFDGVVGNSSSGLLEAPSFQIGTINIGDRQRGRLMANSVISCDANPLNIANAFEKLFSPEFKSLLNGVVNPYDHGDSSSQIVQVLRHQDLTRIACKSFYDL